MENKRQFCKFDMPKSSAESLEQNQRDDHLRGGQATEGEGETSNGARRSNRNCDWYGEQIFRSGLIPQPTNPYFVKKVKRSGGCELYIPTDVIKAFDIELPERILLVDPLGRKYHSKRRVRKDGRVVYSGGWRSLCAMNRVKIDDSCICEFKKAEGGDRFIRVDFVRANKQQE